MMTSFRIGNGYDVHRFAENRKLFLGCVEIPYEFGLLGHSDADVLCHAVCDAMLGACALGDIGKHFPDSDKAYLNMSGKKILNLTNQICKEKGYSVSNLDCIIIAQKPKLSAFIPKMKEEIAAALGISPEAVNVKATTEEGLGFTGRLEGISAHAVCMMEKGGYQKL